MPEAGASALSFSVTGSIAQKFLLIAQDIEVCSECTLGPDSEVREGIILPISWEGTCQSK